MALVHTTVAQPTERSCDCTFSVILSTVHSRGSTRSHLFTTSTTALPAAANISLSRKS